MNTFLITFAIFILVMAGMAIGVIVSNRTIKGSCGGLNAIEGLTGACDICKVKERCKEYRKAQRNALN